MVEEAPKNRNPALEWLQGVRSRPKEFISSRTSQGISGRRIKPSIGEGAQMPIFMDRHDAPPGTTSEQVADAHRRDVEIQEKFGVNFRTYWFDHECGTVFCLIEAPDAATAVRCHHEAHGDAGVPTAIIPVDLAVVEGFLGRNADPSAGSVEAAPAMRAVMFTDIVGSTEMTARLGDSAALEMVRVHDGLVRRALEAHGGREIKHTGDGIMAAFDKASNGVLAASEIQQQIAAYNALARETLRVRIGIHAGEPVADQNDLFGAAVQLAYRLCSEAEANSIVVSELVRKLCEEDATRFEPLGEWRLKGFAEMIPVFRFEWWR
jgi:class 3 adenylate cyclase